MFIDPETRRTLAAQQAALVAALVSQGETPPGFAIDRLSATSQALAHKRVRAVQRAWPTLAHFLGPAFNEQFTTFARGAPLPEHGGPLADGRNFAAWLACQGALPDSLLRQVLAVDVRYARRSQGLVARRGPCLKWCWLPEAGHMLVAVRCPLLGERWLTLALGRWLNHMRNRSAGARD